MPLMQHTHTQRRVALVTGASRGLGETLARLLAQRGFDLVLGARGRADLERVADALRRGRDTAGVTVRVCDGDIADPRTREALVHAAGELGAGRLDLLVNNASELGGISPLTEPTKPTGPTIVDRFERVLRVNVIAPLALTQQALPLLAARGGGLIVNVSSDAAIGAYAGWGTYGASKAALDLITRTLATELTPHAIAAVSVDPGDIRTRMHQEAFPNDDISDRPLPDVTIPFWSWLLDQLGQRTLAINGERFQAQANDPRWSATTAAGVTGASA
jgi:NAD(P)-dependent dehydrogenase (short-subunit alcohol dehydrogenase family)